MNDIRHFIKILEAAKKTSKKFSRTIFLYMEPKDSAKDFAQCGTCFMFMPGKERCSIFGENDKVIAEASCNLYINGTPTDDQSQKTALTPAEAGYIETKVRCENCSWFTKGKCGLFEALNKDMGDIFSLDEKVSPKGCCNAFESK